jgi:phospholipase/lecithinase/hemolysin
MYVFGDSIVDVGNNNHLTISLAKANFPHNGMDFPGGKATGRFCNGKNAADFLAEKVGLPTSPPYLSLTKTKNESSFLRGVSFASGGAGILNGTDDLFRQSIPLLKQVEYFALVRDSLEKQLNSSGGAAQHLAKSLFPIVIGSNDMFGYFKSDSNIAKTMSPQQYVDQLISSLKPLVNRIYTLGARKFIVVGLGAVGCCPSQRSQNKTGACNEATNYWSTKYNEALKSGLEQFQSQLNGFRYTYFNSYAVFTNFLQNPAAYGFTEVRSACCGIGNLKADFPCVPISSYCSNRSDHLFWDLYHPTEKAARIFVDTIFSGSKELVTPINLKQLVDL